jgi:hypothetical protein
MSKRHKVNVLKQPIIIGLVILALSGMGYMYKTYVNNLASNVSTQSHPSYSLNLLGGSNYSANQLMTLELEIKNETGKVLKDYDVVHEKKLHLIVIRSDRTHFQHLHPTLNEKTGRFVLANFTLPTDGVYRIFADFTPSNGQMGPDNMKLPVATYQDVNVGDLSKYHPEPISQDSLISADNGIKTKLKMFSQKESKAHESHGGHESPNVTVTLSRGGKPFTKLQQFLGSLGHMVVIGPNLEYVHAHVLNEDVNNQIGTIGFFIEFPVAGKYRLFLQTQASGKVNTTEYTVSAKPGSSSEYDMSHDGMDMDNDMEMGH